MENIRSRVLTGSLEFNSGNDRGSGGSRGGGRSGSSERNGQRSRGSGRCEDDDSRSGSRRSARGSGRDSGSRNGSKNQTDDGDHDGIYSSSGVNDRSNSSTPQKSSPPSPSSSPSPSPSRRSKSLSVISPKTAPIRNERYRQSISGPAVMSPDKNSLGSPRTIVESVKISPKKIENQSQDNDQNQSQDNSEIIVGNDNQIKSEMKSSSGSTCGVSRSRSYTVSTQQSPFKISPNLPVSSGQIRKLGRDQKKQVEHKEKINIKSDYSENHDNLSRTGTVTGTSIRTRMTERRPTTFIKKGEEVRCNTIKVQVHIALDTFIAASGLQNKSNRGRKQNKNSGIVFKKNGVEDSYREISKSLIPVSINTGDRDRDRDRDNDIKNGKGKEEGKEHKIGNDNNHDTDDDNNDNENHGEKNNVNYEDDFEDHHGEAKAEEKSQLRENEKEQKRAEEKDERNKQIRKSQNQNQDHGDSGPDDDTASVQSHSGFSEFSHLTDHSEEYSSGNQNQKNSVDQDRKNHNKYRKLNIEADKRERLFHKLAPPLNSRQRFLVIMSLLSDVARTLMVSA